MYNFCHDCTVWSDGAGRKNEPVDTSGSSCCRRNDHGISPISSVGALVMAAVAQEEGSEKKYPQNKLFVELFAIAFAGMLILFLLALCGAFGLICGK